MEVLADDCKKKGNDCMKAEKYVEALLHYTKGVKIDPYNPTLYSNRSVAFLKIQQYYHALQDAKTVIAKMPKWVKGYYRKGEIECTVEHYKEAVESYKQGLEIQPDEPTLVKALARAEELWKAQRRSEERIPWYGLSFGALVGIVLIVGDEKITKKPMLENDLIRSLVMILLVLVCYGMALLYRYFLRSARSSLLDPPPDLLDDDDTPTITSQPTSSHSPTSSPDGGARPKPDTKSSRQRKKGRT